MNVQIISVQAALHGGYPGIVWMGDIDADDLGLDELAPPERVNEALFRYFNRVDDPDVDRLAELGFELPSLSVGDLLHWGENTYRVAGTGFDRITHSDEYTVALAQYALRSALDGRDDE